MSDLTARLQDRHDKARVSGGDMMTYGPGDPLALEAKTEIERLRAALKDCADDLEAEVEFRYKDTKDYPSEKLRYERDIAPVRSARAALNNQQSMSQEKKA